MGQAKRRGDFEERKQQSILKEEQRRIDHESTYSSAFSNRNRRGKSMIPIAMLMAALAGMDNGHRR